MTDITERLRHLYVHSGTNYVQEAADTIESLRARVAELEEAYVDSGWPECEEFYSLMQTYRHARIENQSEVVAAYEAVKDWLISTLSAAPKP